MTPSVYLDWNATAPILGAALDAMNRAAREAWGNPASVHSHGRAASARVEEARAAVAELAACDARDVVLTSGGTEANNLALRSAFATRGARDGGARGAILTSRLEHPSITRVAEALEAEGAARVRWIAAREDGAIDLDDLARALAECDADEPALLALQAVNHESGAIQPLADAIPLARARHGPTRVHVDAVQAFGRVGPVLADAARADTRSLAGHKLRGPKGIGALVASPHAKLHPVLVGGAQERGIRPGTVDPVAAAGLAVAALHAARGPERYARVAPLRDALADACAALGALVNGAGARAPHVLNASFPSWNGAELVAALDLEGVSVSSGSACSAGTIEPSPVIRAMLGEPRARSAVRFSLGEETSRADVERAIDVLGRVLRRGGNSAAE